MVVYFVSHETFCTIDAVAYAVEMEILTISFIYTFVYSSLYILEKKLPKKHDYVSHETFLVFAAGIFALIWLFHVKLISFLSQNITVESVAILLFFSVILLLTTVLYRNKVYICTVILRSEKCLVPGYTIVKSADIVFQQISYLLLAIFVSHETNQLFFGAITFLLLLTITHLPVVWGAEATWRYVFLAGIAVLSLPFFYTYVVLGLFWPAVYLHALVYVFLWLGFAEPS